jgi:hypothetical protein
MNIKTRKNKWRKKHPNIHLSYAEKRSRNLKRLILEELKEY